MKNERKELNGIVPKEYKSLFGKYLEMAGEGEEEDNDDIFDQLNSFFDNLPSEYFSEGVGEFLSFYDTEHGGEGSPVMGAARIGGHLTLGVIMTPISLAIGLLKLAATVITGTASGVATGVGMAIRLPGAIKEVMDERATAKEQQEIVKKLKNHLDNNSELVNQIKQNLQKIKKSSSTKKEKELMAATKELKRTLKQGMLDAGLTQREIGFLDRTNAAIPGLTQLKNK